MSHLLYYWRGDNYRRDLDFGVGYHLNQSSPTLHRIDPGESLWAFTRRADGLYVLAAELIAKTKTLNPANFRYGLYRLWGDLASSRYFAVSRQPDITTLIRSLSVRARGDTLGRAFQGHAAVREISDADHLILSGYSRQLPPEPRARLVPEERLEALLLAGDELAVNRLMKEEGEGLAESRRAYLQMRAAQRDGGLVRRLRDMHDGICQVTGWNPRKLYGVDLCEAHHIRWLSRGGQDSIGNLVLIAPNIHRAVHSLDAAFDWKQQAFVVNKDIKLSLAWTHSLVAD